MDHEKKPTSLNLRVDHIEWMEENIRNRSGFVNELIEHYRQGTSEMNAAVAQFRREQLQSEKHSLQARIESIESELEKVEKNIAQSTEQAEATMQEAVSELRNTSADPTNPAIKNWAGKLNMSPIKFCEKLEERRNE